jgi:hypothetical protein
VDTACLIKIPNFERLILLSAAVGVILSIVYALRFVDYSSLDSLSMLPVMIVAIPIGCMVAMCVIYAAYSALFRGEHVIMYDMKIIQPEHVKLRFNVWRSIYADIFDDILRSKWEESHSYNDGIYVYVFLYEDKDYDILIQSIAEAERKIQEYKVEKSVKVSSMRADRAKMQAMDDNNYKKYCRK